MLHYYRQLYPGQEEALARAVSQDLNSIEDYLNSAIKAIKQKEKIEASWRRLSEPQGGLELKGRLYRIPKTEVVVSTALRGYSEGEEIYARGGRYTIKRKEGDDKAIFSQRYGGEKLFAKDDTLHEAWVELLKPTHQVIDDRVDEYVVYVEDGVQPVDPEARPLLDDELWSSFLSRVSHLQYQGESLSVQVSREGVLLNDRLEDLVDQSLLAEPYALPVVLKRRGRGGRDAGRWIQLIEKDDEGGEEETMSPLRYFFDDDVIIKDSEGSRYEVLSGRDDEYQLRLQKVGDRKGKDCYPPQDAILSVQVNTYQLQRQLEAVRTLRERPLEEHWPLLMLFLKRGEFKPWDHCVPAVPKSWHVLTDDSRSGCQEQRAFVSKALGTPDYAFLAGPPGSGKTTVILELICQLIAQKKRVLLCSSTHVAIDNVLERLDERLPKGSLIDRLHIMALRVGDRGRISERVTHFQIDEVLKDCPDDMHRLIRQSANLVCGTTMGILQYPDFKRAGKEDPAPVMPDFDYLIIDESSKTTFQEFLVPALRAKRWILVGDVLQLSPYTERELVEANIRQLKSKGERIAEEHQQAIYLLHQLGEFYSKRGRCRLIGKYAIPVTAKVLSKLREEYDSGRGQNTSDGEGFTSAFVGGDNYHHYNRLLLSPYDIIFIERGLEDKGLIPETHAVLWSKIPEEWRRSSHSFQFRALEKSLRYAFVMADSRGSILDKIRKEGEPLERLIERISYELYARSWAGEVAWRIDREHQIRLQEQSKYKGGYNKQIEELMPIADRKLWTGSINRLSAIAFPSILEALERGIIRKWKDDGAVQGSPLADGFDPDFLVERREILTYQHRMHPEISHFPRRRFYYERSGQSEALLDNPMLLLQRSWGYREYPRREHWIDVENGHIYRGANEAEAKRMMEELDKFADYAETASPSDNPERPWTVACLCFYRGQERKLKELLQKKTGMSNRSTHFVYRGLMITLCTVDRFQGQEADIVFLSMVQTRRVGFMDSPNRLNVAVTRARYQNVIIGSLEYFSSQSASEDLRQLALYASGREMEKRPVRNVGDSGEKRRHKPSPSGAYDRRKEKSSNRRN